MIAEAYINDDVIHVRLDGGGAFCRKYYYDYDIGADLLDFVAIDIETLNSSYNELIEFILENKEQIIKSRNILKQYLDNNQKKFGIDCVYLNYYNNRMITGLYSSLINKKDAFNGVKKTSISKSKAFPLILEIFDPVDGEEDYFGFFLRRLPIYSQEAAYIYEKYGLDSIELYLYLLKTAFLEEIYESYKHLIKEIDALIAFNKNQANLNMKQMLYQLDRKRMKNGLEPFYTGKKSAVVLDRVWKSNIPSICEQSIQDLNVYEENPTVDEITLIESIDELFRYEIIKIANSKLKIKRCENCGKFFIPRGKRCDTKYCNRIAPGKKDICSVVGANAKYMNSRKHPAMELYNKANKHYNYVWRSVGSISEEDYKKWKYYTTNMREKCRDNEIILEEFEKWINLDFHKAIAKIECRKDYVKYNKTEK